MEFLGSMERLAAQMYPYRWPIAGLLLLLMFGGGLLAYRRNWHQYVWRRKLVTSIVLLPVLVVSIPVGYYMLSPLWTRTVLEEESPLAIASGAIAAQATSTPSVASSPTPVAPPTSTAAATMTSGTEPTAVAEARIDPTAEPAAPATATAGSETLPQPAPKETPTPAPESEPEPEPTEFVPFVLASGGFIGADDFHFGSGSALLIATAPDQFVLRLEDFSVRNGPDLFVYLSTNADGWSEDALNLGELRATDGSFNYDVPAGVDVSQYRSVVVWCRAFAVLFSTATFE